MSWMKTVDAVAAGKADAHDAVNKIKSDMRHGVIPLPEAYWRESMISFAAVASVTGMGISSLQHRVAKMAGTPLWNLLPGAMHEIVYQSVAAAVGLDQSKLSNPAQLRMEAIQSATLMSWGYGKGVYIIDADVAEAIATSDLSGIPHNQLKYMPHTTMFIGNDVNDCVGCFFSRIEVESQGKTALSFLMVKRGWPFLPQDRPDFSAGTIDLSLGEDLDHVFGNEAVHDLATFKAYVNMLLLCCCKNVEIRGRSTSTHGPSVDSATKAALVTPAPRLWDVASREGAALRASAAAVSASSSSSERSSPRAHMRRAHWHSYHAKNASTGNPEIRVHWVAPILVGAVEDIVETHHAVTR